MAKNNAAIQEQIERLNSEALRLKMEQIQGECFFATFNAMRENIHGNIPLPAFVTNFGAFELFEG